MISFRKWMTVALLAASVGIGSAPALALVAIPEGFADGSATDQLTVSGTYATPLPSPLAQPFAAPDFTLSIDIPAQVLVSAAGPVLSEFYVMVSGSYTNDDQTETFTDQIATFGATNEALPTFPDNFSLSVENLLASPDSYVFEFQANAALFSPTIFTAGEPETFTLGDFTVNSGDATYSVDPNFTGTIDVTSQVTAVPEPASLALFCGGLIGLGFLRGRTRKAA